MLIDRGVNQVRDNESALLSVYYEVVYSKSIFLPFEMHRELVFIVVIYCEFRDAALQLLSVGSYEKHFLTIVFVSRMLDKMNLRNASTSLKVTREGRHQTGSQ